MSLLISEDDLVARKEVAAGPLRPLALSLARDLTQLLDRDLYFPGEKALLSREGGRCPRHGVLLAFDPFSRNEHRCPIDGEIFRGPLHDRFWIYWYQLWLAERAVHAAALWRLGVDERFHALATGILEGYLARYSSYPNADNVLGPSRLFFSTYLESIWLLQVCFAVALLDALEPALTARVRDLIIEPARAIIREYDEGSSNRQVWNDAALLASNRLLGDINSAEQAVFGPSGIVSHLSGGLLSDGTWYEGENYHLFAHRGLWYGVTMAEQAGIELPENLLDRFQRGFAAPFVTALPDFTFPSRRDSQYAVSLRQWRIAEHCELGIARRNDPELSAALYRLYHDDVQRRDTGRSTSSADVERNVPASSLTRADLNWRALLCALPELPAQSGEAIQRSALLDAQGLAVFRRNAGRTYVALDYGHSGGGHGHPDRLNLLLSNGDTRWLDDPGTGAYVDPSLHWYRSSLAHNAPLVDGRSQDRVAGTLVAYDERESIGWIVARVALSSSASLPTLSSSASLPTPSSSASEASGGSISDNSVAIVRTVVVLENYLIDELTWSAEADITIDLPLHIDLLLRSLEAPTPGVLSGSNGVEDGFRFLRDTVFQRVPANSRTTGTAVASNDDVLSAWSVSDRDAEWWRALAVGPPGGADQHFRIVRARGAAGRHRFVLAWSPDVADASLDDEIRITFTNQPTHVHFGSEDGWTVVRGVERVHLDGIVEPPVEVPLVVAQRPAPSPIIISRRARTLIPLGEANYRRSEQSWREAGEPAGSVAFERIDESLRLIIEVTTSELTFVPADAINPYDNEPADINGDSVQLYLRKANGLSGWTLVPTLESVEVRLRMIEGWDAPCAISAAWERTEAGYSITVDLDSIPQALDVIVNEMPRGRERRRGQLVLSGAAGEFIYLRGDRHDQSRLIPIRLMD